MYAGHESARTRPNTGGYLVLVAAVGVTASATTSCTNLAAIPTTAPAPVPTPPRRRRRHRRCGVRAASASRPAGVGSIMVGLLGCAELGVVGFQLGVGGLQVQDLGDAGEVDPGVDEVGDAP